MALNLDPIRAAADRVAASFGMEVVDLEFSGNPKSRALRVFLEKNEQERQKFIAAAAADGADPLPSGVPVESLSGVTHEDCASFANDFGTILDVEDLIPGAEYTLEVSSPGLDRKLTTPRDFERFRGSLIKLQTREPIQENRQWRGRLAAVQDGSIQLDPSALKQKGKPRKAAAGGSEPAALVSIPLALIEKANLLPEI